MKLSDVRALGRSGLLVSPLTLGTMTFGTARWGSPEDISKAVFDAYVDEGGNSIDTADVYAGGRSEEMVGRFIAERKLRDKMVLATKFGFNGEAGNPHAGGNGRKNIYRALEGSLRRLGTDYIDLYWLHVWDMVTPVDEVLQSLGDLVRAGKIRYFGLSDMPAWYAAKAATLAGAHGSPGPIAMQLQFSLVERGIEQEHVAAARECGMGIMPWSPLAGGYLTGKYTPEEKESARQGRLGGSNPFQGEFTKFTDQNWRILATLRDVAAQVDRPLAQVALAWISAKPGITSIILGASKVEQLRDNLASLDVQLTSDHLRALDEISASPPGTTFFTPDVKRMIFGGSTVEGWH